VSRGVWRPCATPETSKHLQCRHFKLSLGALRDPRGAPDSIWGVWEWCDVARLDARLACSRRAQTTFGPHPPRPCCISITSSLSNNSHLDFISNLQGTRVPGCAQTGQEGASPGMYLHVSGKLLLLPDIKVDTLGADRSRLRRHPPPARPCPGLTLLPAPVSGHELLLQSLDDDKVEGQQATRSCTRHAEARPRLRPRECWPTPCGAPRQDVCCAAARRVLHRGKTCVAPRQDVCCPAARRVLPRVGLHQATCGSSQRALSPPPLQLPSSSSSRRKATVC
jgi:hypothetical protein